MAQICRKGFSGMVTRSAPLLIIIALGAITWLNHCCSSDCVAFFFGSGGGANSEALR